MMRTPYYLLYIHNVISCFEATRLLHHMIPLKKPRITPASISYSILCPFDSNSSALNLLGAGDRQGSRRRAAKVARPTKSYRLETPAEKLDLSK